MKPQTPDWMIDFFSANQGLVRFDHFMHAALYHPLHGYYSRADRVFGAEGDFVTAPELTPLFGQTLARALREPLADCGGHVWEFGAGRGLLARDLMLALGDAVTCYHIVDVSGALQAIQRDTLLAAGIDVDRRVRWERTLPDMLKGVIIGNEVLDAMPVRLFGWHSSGITERYVQLDNGILTWRDQPADSELAGFVGELEALHGPWPEGYMSEWPEQIQAFVSTLTERLEGVAVMIDYGFGAGEFYHPQRSTGTLVAHYRHQMHDGVLLRPGEQDITAHVDFSTVFNALDAAGGELLGYTGQAAFLLHNGLTADLTAPANANPATPASDPASGETSRGATASTARIKADAQLRQAIQTLVSPAEMGELFKVIVWSRNVNPDAWPLTAALARMDRSRQL